MGRYKQAPWNFQCPFRNACPHMGGISATWAGLLISDRDRDYFREGHSWVEARIAGQSFN